jgi:ATP-grasp ribosomal peptide maturase
MSVLILARDTDFTADHVVRALDERGAVVHRVNTAWFPTGLDVSVRLRDQRWSGALRTPTRTVDLDEVTAVLYRAPEAYRFPASLTPAERQHANLEAKYGLGGVLSSLPVLWVDHPARMADAAYKPVQLATAAQCGLLVPDTMITTVDTDVRRFADEGPTVTKLLGSNMIAEQGVRKLSFTRLLDQTDLADLAGLGQTTHAFQRWVPKRCEARVVVIGHHVTATAIHAGSPASLVDWRSDYDALSYEAIELPATVEAGIRDLMHRFDLRYGALDFVITPDGEWVFLELNPGGQYGWIEAATGVPLTAYLADLLTSGAPADAT